MKIFIPKNISRGLFNMSIQMGPLSLSLVQLFLIAAGLGLSLGVWNILIKQWLDKVTALFFVLPILLIFIVVAFFKFSELTLLPFMGKIIKTYFIDTTKKYQVNFKKIDPADVAEKYIKQAQEKKKIVTKDLNIDHEKLKKLKSLIEED